jgi:hypothetical protein|tara:strand:- start:170 stop:493 length:324 start_codon:yes stop_codon:yes gene_type:complete
MSKRTDAYVMTAHTKSAGDMLEIETIRKSVISINKINKRKEKIAEYRYNTGWSDTPPQSLPRYRVTLHGRGPRTRQSILDGKGFRGYDRELPLKYAERIDVYIHERS